MVIQHDPVSTLTVQAQAFAAHQPRRQSTVEALAAQGLAISSTALCIYAAAHRRRTTAAADDSGRSAAAAVARRRQMTLAQEEAPRHQSGQHSSA